MVAVRLTGQKGKEKSLKNVSIECTAAITKIGEF